MHSYIKFDILHFSYLNVRQPTQAFRFNTAKVAGICVLRLLATVKVARNRFSSGASLFQKNRERKKKQLPSIMCRGQPIPFLYSPAHLTL
jgi:hypothetical protein